MFVEKQELIAMHQNEFEAWQRLLSSLSPGQTTNPLLPNGLSVKDTVAHLATWLERTIARLEAALDDHEPHFPQWPVELDEEESSEAVDRANKWILETHRHRPWTDVYQEWRKDYLRFLELLRALPESDLRPDGKLSWVVEYQPLKGYPGEYDYHHAEHRVELEDWIRKQAAL